MNCVKLELSKILASFLDNPNCTHLKSLPDGLDWKTARRVNISGKVE
ncbi:hypothetical protein T01_11182 [Trichinella spiralis]|uniref:Uncharacterized protein n=1 Tax=Trichinella spiralis TaxID=6334 RepID=A0A0V1C0F9_TRISP|nr:hypothetical protein T01_11182 [Trichinella spiralis]